MITSIYDLKSLPGKAARELLAQVVAGACPVCPNAEVSEGHLSVPEIKLMIAYEDGELAGFAAWHRKCQLASIDWIWIRPESDADHLGEVLVEAIRVEASTMGLVCFCGGLILSAGA